MHLGPDRLSLGQTVAATLDAAGIPFALIGAAAMGLHGVNRSTADLDLLVVDNACLTDGLWSSLRDQGVEIEIRKGDWSDPLAGVVRFWTERDAPVDLVVGKLTWQRKVIERAKHSPYYGIPAAGAADLILLKLYAEGSADGWDIQHLLDAGDRADLISQVESRLSDLPSGAAAFWRQVLGE